MLPPRTVESVFLPFQVSEQVGNVIEVMPNGDVYVFFEYIGKAYVFNPAALKPEVPTTDEISCYGTQCTLAYRSPGKI